MVNFLRKLFIKNYLDVTNTKVREKHGLLANFVGVFTNLILFVIKIVTGSLTFSMAIISDAINNLSDMANCVISLVGFKLSSKPADKEHPFGHQKIEYIAGLIVSFVIIALAIIMGYSAISKIISHAKGEYVGNDADPSIITFVLLGVAILIKIWQGLFYKKMGKIINSVALKANSQDSFNDVISTSSVLIASLLLYILKKYVPSSVSHLYLIDSIMSILVAIFIIISGVKLVIETSNPLIGCTPDHEFVKEIVKDICAYDGVLGIHDLIVHSYGPSSLFMTIHVEVDANINVLVSHDLMDNIEHDIKKKYSIEITVHMDPIVTDSETTNTLKGHLGGFLSEYSTQEAISFHDFRIVEGVTHTNILFDLVIGFDSKINENDLREYLIKKYKEISPTYNVIVTVEHSYI